AGPVPTKKGRQAPPPPGDGDSPTRVDTALEIVQIRDRNPSHPPGSHPLVRGAGGATRLARLSPRRSDEQPHPVASSGLAALLHARHTRLVDASLSVRVHGPRVAAVQSCTVALIKCRSGQPRVR